MTSRFTDEANAASPRRHELGDRLGNRPLPTHILRILGKPDGVELAAAVRLERACGLSAGEVSKAARCARVLARRPHANLGRMREPVVGNGEVLLVSDFIDGENLSGLWHEREESVARPPLEVWLRVLADVLAGLQALHGMRDGDGPDAGFFHGEVTPSNVVAGIDGVARLIHHCRIAGGGLKVPGAPPYLAPELLLQDPKIDFRADLYSVGVLLWEAISGGPLFPEDKTTVIIRKMLTGALPAPPVPREVSWAAELLPVVARALSIAPADRFASAEAMLAAIESAVKGHIASSVDVSRWVCELAGARIMARRARHGGLPIELPRHAPPASPVAPVAIPVAPVAPPPPRISVPDAPIAPIAAPPPPFGFDALLSSAELSEVLPGLSGRDERAAEVEPKRTARPWLWVAGAVAAGILALGALVVWALRWTSTVAAANHTIAGAAADASQSRDMADLGATGARGEAPIHAAPVLAPEPPAPGESAPTANGEAAVADERNPSVASGGVGPSTEPTVAASPPTTAPAGAGRSTSTAPGDRVVPAAPGTGPTKPPRRGGGSVPYDPLGI